MHMNFATKRRQIIKWLYLAMRTHRQRVAVANAESIKDDLEKQISKKQITNRPLFEPERWCSTYPCIFTQVQEGIIMWPDDEIIATGPQRTDTCPQFNKLCDGKYTKAKQEYLNAKATYKQEKAHLDRMLTHRIYAFHKIFEKSQGK